MKTRTRVLALLLVLLTLLGSFSLNAFAIDWDGASADTGSGGRPADVNGYALRFYPGDNCVGYRFSCVDKYGNNRVTKVIDVFRNSYYGDVGCDSDYKFNSKYNKKQLIDRQYGSFSTSRVSNNCYKEATMGFATSLGAPDTMEAWQNIEKNLNVILTTLGIGTIDDLKNGDKILVEPIYEIKIQTIYHALTTTEACVYGAAILGMDSDGGASSTASTWGFISVGPNRVYPNHLFTPDGQGLWPGATLLAKRATFRTIINVGYGVGIAFTQTKPDFEPELNVQETRAYKGTAYSKTFRYGTSTANTFSAYAYNKGYPAYGDKIFFTVVFPVESENAYVKQTVWIDGIQAGTRKGYTDNLTLYDVKPEIVTISKDKSYYTIEAEEDWIDDSGKVLKYGVKKSFYIPVKPTVFRPKVTAYNVNGEAQAYSGENGSEGALYSGQKVYTKYDYTSDNTWGSYNHLTAISNSISSDEDVSKTKALLSKDSPKTYKSSLDYVTVPIDSSMKFTLTSAWYSDEARTKEKSTYIIPVIQADVELSDIVIADSKGNVLDEQNLEIDDTVYVYYTYKNNTTVAVQVDGYDNSGKMINDKSSFYNIPANGSITVNGGSLTVPDKEKFTVWGGVYLHGMVKGDTSYESNGKNNEMTLDCHTRCALSLVPITPNASYRENTTVFSSFWLVNDGSKNYIPKQNVSAEFTVKKNDGSVITTVSKTKLVVPGKDKNLVYIKWSVPEGLNKDKITIDAHLYVGEKEEFSVSKKYSTVPYTVYSTPDTQYERSAPLGFTVSETPANDEQYASWWIYTYADGSFTKNEYCVGVIGTQKISPATGETDYMSGSQHVMKSGYGISITAIPTIGNVSGYKEATSAMRTGSQYVTVMFPEFAYKATKNNCRTLIKSGSKWTFRENGEYGNVHFTPLYFPDGGYTAVVSYSDIWTPAGMITVTKKTNTIKIEGSAYDDWYISR